MLLKKKQIQVRCTKARNVKTTITTRATSWQHDTLKITIITDRQKASVVGTEGTNGMHD